MILLVFLIYSSGPPEVTVLRQPSWDACQEAAMTRAETALRERKRAWFKCVEVAG